MMTKEGCTKIVNFMNLGAGVVVLGCGHISYIVKMHYFFKNLSCLLPSIDKTNYKYILMKAKEGSTKIVTFMTQGAGVLVLGCGHISENALFLKNLSCLLPGKSR